MVLFKYIGTTSDGKELEEALNETIKEFKSIENIRILDVIIHEVATEHNVYHTAWIEYKSL